MANTHASQWWKWLMITTACVFIRLCIEWFFPLIPFQTNNSYPRIVMEMPFYYAVARSYQLIGGEGTNPGNGAITLGVALLEGIAIGSLLFFVWYFQWRTRRT